MKLSRSILFAISALWLSTGGCISKEPHVSDLLMQVGYVSPPPPEVLDKLRKGMPGFETDLLHAYTGSPPGNSREAIAIVLGELGTAKTDKFLFEQKKSVA